MNEVKQPRQNILLGSIQSMGSRLADMNIYLFFLIVFIYHVIVIFQGLDFNDEGFHVAFYQQIFNNPESVQYAFWGWFTGIVGGTFMKMFPYLGIWGIRLLGAIISTATIAIAYNLLKRYLHNGYLKVSMILLSLFINEDAKNLYYNNLSAFLYFVTAYFIFTGLRDNKRWMLFAAGFFVGLNIFTRLPNLLGIGLILAIFSFGFMAKKNIRYTLVRSVIFLAGTGAALFTVYLTMRSLNHLFYFLESVKMISTSSKGAKVDDGLDGAYGITHLLKVNMDDYVTALRFLVVFCIPVLITGFINRKARNGSNALRKAVWVFNIAMILSALLFSLTGRFTGFRLLELFTAVSLLSILVLFERKVTNDLKLLAIVGVLILLIHPFGSSAGIATVVVYSMWISFPIAVDYIARLKWAAFDLKIETSAGVSSLQSVFTEMGFRILKWVLISVIAIGCLYNVVKYPYLCDSHSRWLMRYSVNNRFMKGVFTSKARAETLNDLLNASSRYIHPNDIVLAYDCMPMYHYMTETRSYVRNPCIWFYTTTLFEQQLAFAETHEKVLPVIVRQLIKTTGDGSGWPETEPAENYLFFKRTKGKNDILNDFIKRHNYNEVWSNGDFQILVPR
jgi:hypothetical protein